MQDIQLTFDASFQRALIRLMMVDGAFAVKALKWLHKGHFTQEALGWAFDVLSGYFKQYSIPPTDIVMRDSLRGVPPDKLGRFHTEVETIISLGDVPEALYVKEQLAEFVKQAIFSRAHYESAMHFNEGKRTKAYDVMAIAQEKIQQVSFTSVDRIWLFDSYSDRNQERIRDSLESFSNCFSTGVPQLDASTDGGVHPEELWVVFAYAKRCKSTWLINQGFNATKLHRKKVAHFVLEGSGKQTASRYDACFSLEHYSKVKSGDLDPLLDMQLRQEYASLREKCVIRTLNNWDVNIFDIEAELEFLKTSHRFRPDMIIVDYMDLGRSRSRATSEMEHQVAFARDLKRLILKGEYAGWSAWQAQRPKANAHTRKHLLSSANVADAYAKVRIVDAYGSLNATDEEMGEGTMRLFWEGHRDAPVNKVWQITNDLARMRMVTSAHPYTPEAA